MNTIKYFLTFLIYFYSKSHETFGQTSVGLRNYIFSPIVVSPSYAGRTNGEVKLIYNNQWAGLDGSPKTFIFSVDFLNPYKLGSNLQVYNDQIGPIRNTSLKLSNAYHLQITNDDYFSFGLQHGVNNLAVDVINSRYLDQEDFIILNGNVTAWNYNIDISGTYYNPWGYAGLTFRNLVRTNILINNYSARGLHFYFGSETQMTKDWDFSYSILVNWIENLPVDPNVHCFFKYLDKQSFGATFSRNSIGAAFQIDATESHKLFYTFNLPLSQLAYFTRQSHAVGISIDLIKPNRVVIESPLFFL